MTAPEKLTDVAASLFQRIYHESIGRVVDEKTKELLAQLAGLSRRQSGMEKASILQRAALHSNWLRHKVKSLNFFSLITTVGGRDVRTHRDGHNI